MSDVRIRTAAPGDIAAIGRIYADAVRNGTATFEIEPPTEAEIARRVQALLANNYPYLWPSGWALSRVTPMPALIIFARPIAGPLRIRSISIRNSKGKESAAC